MSHDTSAHQQPSVTVIKHPLVQHKLSLMRQKETSTGAFRTLLSEIGTLLAYEVTRDLPLKACEIQTPVATMQAPFIDGKKLVLVSILRAGEGLLEGFLRLIPSARVSHIGLYRQPTTLEIVHYYFKAPSDIAEREVIILDPMLATGNSAVAAIKKLTEHGASQIKFVSLVAAPEGVANVHACYPKVPIFTAALDEKLNSHGYIVPGLGDAGDRIFGTK